jgi:RNA polymerase sigma-70 factor (ECF subfamily)
VTSLLENDVAQLYEQHFDFVWRSLRRLGVRTSQLEDAVQDVFVVVQRRLADFERRSSVKTWLFGIALRVAKDHRRRVVKLAVEIGADTEALVGTHPDPRQAAIETEAALLVQSLLDGLPEERRVVFVMSDLEGFTAAEIAEGLGIGVNSVYSRLRLARRDFAQALRAARARADWKQR